MGQGSTCPSRMAASKSREWPQHRVSVTRASYSFKLACVTGTAVAAAKSLNAATGDCSSISAAAHCELCLMRAMVCIRQRCCSGVNKPLPLLLSSSRSARGLFVVKVMSAALRYSSCSAGDLLLMLESTWKACELNARNRATIDSCGLQAPQPGQGIRTASLLGSMEHA